MEKHEKRKQHCTNTDTINRWHEETAQLPTVAELTDLITFCFVNSNQWK